MRRIIVIMFLTVTCVYLAVAKGPVPPILNNCYGAEISKSFNNVHAYGDMLINFNSLYSLSEFINRGCIISLTVKATKTCNYTWNQTYSNNDSRIVGNTIHDVMIPQTSDYSITVKVESPCIYDSFLGRNVKLVWTKTVNSL